MKSIVDRLQIHRCETHNQQISLLCLEEQCKHRSRRLCKLCIWNNYSTHHISIIQLGNLLNLELGDLLQDIGRQDLEVTEQGIDRLGEWLSKVIDLDYYDNYTFKEGVHLYNESGRFIGLDQLYQNQSMEQLAYEWKQKESIRLDDFVVQVLLNLDSSQIMVICEKSIKLFIQWKPHQWTESKQPWNDIHENVKIVNCDNNLKMMAVQYQNSKIITIWKKESNSENWFKQGQIADESKLAESVIFNEVEQSILVTGQDSIIRIYQVVNKKYQLSNTLDKHVKRVNGICLSDDYKMLVSVSEDNRMYLWKQNVKQEWQFYQQIFGPKIAVHHIQFNQTSTLLLASCDYTKVRIWQKAQCLWKLLVVVSSSKNSSLCVIFNNHTHIVLSRHSTKKLRIWRPNVKHQSLAFTNSTIVDSQFIAINNSQNRLLQCPYGKKVIVYRYPTE